MLVYIPRFSRLLNTLEQLLLRLDGYLIVQFKLKGVQVLNATLHEWQRSGRSIESRFRWGFQNADGKELPKNTRALRMIAEEVIRDILVKVHSYEELMIERETRSVKSRTAKHWIQNHVKPVLLIMAFVRAEIRENRHYTCGLSVRCCPISMLLGT